jgi:hypothetical protein
MMELRPVRTLPTSKPWLPVDARRTGRIRVVLACPHCARHTSVTAGTVEHHFTHLRCDGCGRIEPVPLTILMEAT